VSAFVHVGHVRDHLDDRPFSRLWAAADLVAVQVGDQLVEDHRAGPHRLENLLVQIKHLHLQETRGTGGNGHAVGVQALGQPGSAPRSRPVMVLPARSMGSFAWPRGEAMTSL